MENGPDDLPCWNAECVIPSPDPSWLRIREVRKRIISLQKLIDAGTICRIYEVDIYDLELLAAAEEALNSDIGKAGCDRERCKHEYGEYYAWACERCEFNS